MRIFQFIEKYCQDLVEAAKVKRELIDLEEFPHDAVIEDVEGKRIPVVIVDSESIPVSDCFTMDRKDFLFTWKLPNAGEAYDNYVSALEILEGEDAVSRIRNAILAEQERLSHDVELITEV